MRAVSAWRARASVGAGFVVCAFVPRKLDYHPRSIPAPYHHANVDSDEVLYYCDGDFTSRRGSGIAAGSISLHPAGFVHGPQPGSVANAAMPIRLAARNAKEKGTPIHFSGS